MTGKDEIYALGGDFNGMGKNYNFDDRHLSFDTNFKMGRDILNAGADYAEEAKAFATRDGVEDIYSLPYMKGADLDGDKKVSREEAASYFIALSMADTNSTKLDNKMIINTGNGQTITTTTYSADRRPTHFDNSIDNNDMYAAIRDPERVAAMARQIFFDNGLGGLSEQSQAAKTKDLEKIHGTATGHDTTTARTR